MGLIRRYPALVPLLLLGPGLAWLASFYLAPNVQMFASSFWSGTLEGGFSFSLANWVNYPNALDRKSTRLNSSHVSESRMPSSA